MERIPSTSRGTELSGHACLPHRSCRVPSLVRGAVASSTPVRPQPRRCGAAAIRLHSRLSGRRAVAAPRGNRGTCLAASPSGSLPVAPKCGGKHAQPTLASPWNRGPRRRMRAALPRFSASITKMTMEKPSQVQWESSLIGWQVSTTRSSVGQTTAKRPIRLSATTAFR